MPVEPNVYELNAPDVVSETFDGQAVILNLATGHYYSLGGIAGPLWNLLIGRHSTDAILASVAAQQPHLVQQASALVAPLLSFGLSHIDASICRCSGWTCGFQAPTFVACAKGS